MIKLSHQIKNNVCVIAFEGTLVLEQVEVAQDYVFGLIGDPIDFKGVVFDWEHVEYVDSLGVTLILSVHKFLQNQKKTLTLCQLTDINQEMLHGLALDTYIRVFPTEIEALSSYNESSGQPTS